MVAQQLSLHLSPRLPYAAANFVKHAGVTPLVESLMGILKGVRGELIYIRGTPRAGKTHLCVALADWLVGDGYVPRLLDGEELRASDEWQRRSFGACPEEVLLLDAAQAYLMRIKPGASGPWVALVERIRRTGAKLVVASDVSLSELPCDEHVLSRLRGAHLLEIGAPNDADMPALVGSMARQRGLSLGERHIEFLSSRLSREPRAIEEYFDRLTHLSEVTGKHIKFQVLGDAL